MNVPTDTIVAPATASGGAIAVIRLSGPEAIACCDRIFRGRKPLAEAAGHTLHYGEVIDGDRMIDDVVAAIYRAPHSYTGEDAVELSCHGSHYIVSEIIALLLRSGARMAQPGEFTIRAFLAGRMDLAQAEAVADLIASDSRASHAMASTQMRGGYSAALGALRNELLQLASLLELELDFSEEDVQFADRARLREMMHRIESEITRLTDSFRLGNAIKKGVAVAIVGVSSANPDTLFISAKTGEGIERLLARLRATFDTGSIYDGDPVISNSRHLDALRQALDALHRALTALDDDRPADLLSEDIRQVIHHLGTITGEITNDDILIQIFSKFCIGK